MPSLDALVIAQPDYLRAHVRAALDISGPGRRANALDSAFASAGFRACRGAAPHAWGSSGWGLISRDVANDDDARGACSYAPWTERMRFTTADALPNGPKRRDARRHALAIEPSAL